MKILLYYPSNKRSIPMETMVKQHLDHGHEMLLLTTCERGDFHQQLEAMGVKTATYSLLKTNTVLFYIKHIFHLIRFSRQHKVDVIYSHLQVVNIMAVIAQFFTPASLIVFRHHDYSKNKKEKITDSIINRLAKHIVVPSSGVRNLMLANEKVNPEKVSIIPYIYTFENYDLLDGGHSADIKQQYKAELLLIMVSRLVVEKRHRLVFEVMKRLVAEGKDIKLLVMDEGAEKESLQHYIQQHNLEQHIVLLGFQTNIIDYIRAADVMVHPSLAEASCSAVKEAGLKEKIVIACHDVGDFDDYIKHKENGFLLDKANSEAQLYQYLQEILADKSAFKTMGEKLKTTIVQTFSPSEAVMRQYNKLLVSYF